MKEYPSIPNSLKAPKEKCFAFYKYDGSNLRFEWNNKRGFYKFGTRHQLFDQNHEVFGSAINIFKNKYADGFEKAIIDKYGKVESAICFAEFLGPNSFAGSHLPEDKKDVILFDVNIHKRGILDPETFQDLFQKLDTAQLLYSGVLTDEFIEGVRNNTLETKLNEGVICKGGSGHKLWMCKVKTKEYLDKLKSFKGSDWEKYWE